MATSGGVWVAARGGTTPQDGAKGVYHINAVDCVTQWEVVASCEKISEAYLLPVLGELPPWICQYLYADD